MEELIKLKKLIYLNINSGGFDGIGSIFEVIVYIENKEKQNGMPIEIPCSNKNICNHNYVLIDTHSKYICSECGAIKYN